MVKKRRSQLRCIAFGKLDAAIRGSDWRAKFGSSIEGFADQTSPQEPDSRSENPI